MDRIANTLGRELMTRLRFAVAQIGVAGGRGMPDVLPSADELGPGFRVIDQRRWRTGLGDEPFAVRARRSRSVTAWRSFGGPDDSSLWAQAIPLFDDDDAASALVEVWKRALSNLRFRGEVGESRPGPSVPSLGESASTLEQAVSMRGFAYLNRSLAWRNRNVISVISAAGRPDRWPWSELEAIAGRQNARITHRLAARK